MVTDLANKILLSPSDRTTLDESICARIDHATAAHG
jgi:hypothetical protein